MATALRPRWFGVLLVGLATGVLASAPGHLKTRALLEPLVYGISFGCAVMYSVRTRTLTPTDEGLWIYRSRFNQMFAAWEEVRGVERRRIGPFATDQLILREPVRKHVRSDMRSPAEIVWKSKPNQHVLIGLYDKRWRNGPIGAALAARGSRSTQASPQTQRSLLTTSGRPSALLRRAGDETHRHPR